MIDYKKELNEGQYKAVTTTEGPVLILAGAGSGKTRTLIYRVAYLIEHGVNPENILLLTFTNKAAGEMVERAEQMLDSRCKDIVACTYHSFCAKQLRKYAPIIGFSPNYTIIDAADAATIINMLKTDLNIQNSKEFPTASKVVSILSMSLNKNLSIKDTTERYFEKYKGYVKDIELLKKKYTEYKNQNFIMDYDDLLIHYLVVLKKRPDICKKVSDTFKYIMVDEYQDSNYLQEQIILELRKENQNLAVVGDDAQSIYGFRGSCVQNIIDFPKRFPNTTTIILDKNYRSNQEILDLSNHFMKIHVREGIAKKLQGTHSRFRGPALVETDSCKDECRFVLNEILMLKTHKGLSYNDICVLVRNSSQSNLLETELTKLNVPYQKFGGLKFFEKAHVKDVLSYFRCITNPRDEIAWFRLLKLHPAIGDKIARELAKKCKEQGLDGLIYNDFKKRKFYSELLLLYNECQTLNNMYCLEDLVKEVIEFYYVLRKRVIAEMRTDEDTRAEEYYTLEKNKEELLIFIELCQSYKDIISFTDDLTLDNKKETVEKEEMLTISTIHSAKGLEFHTVFILDCVDEIFPKTKKEDMYNEDDREELRCFYVAATRAKENLYLMRPRFAFLNGRTFQAELSHFLLESEDKVEKRFI